MYPTSKIIMVRPANFGFNPETAGSNAFQKNNTGLAEQSGSLAQAEFDAAIAKLRSAGVDIHVFEDTAIPVKPDAVFPNNWISLHENGTIILYPMLSEKRRLERREDIVKELTANYAVLQVYDFSASESEGKFLEGTGSIVFDHLHKFAYAALSPRTHLDLFQNLCSVIGYKPVAFHAADHNGNEIYHTNVLMCIGSGFAVICTDSLTDKSERDNVIRLLQETDHEVVAISFEQMNSFAGNMILLKNNAGEQLLVMSESAYNSLFEEQKTILSKYARLLPLSIPTIETLGGGSARCMIAENFLPEKVR
ncbi:MAG: amidinotransferase [Ignavibacteriales bacterium]|nr:MAG: amidinotransferase [Ignavibacteriales bacterium]